MNFANYIAHRWVGSSPLKHTRSILRMGVGSMALCIAVMVVSVCILHGFKNEIREKVYGFGSHIVVQPYLIQDSGQDVCIRWNDSLEQTLTSIEGIVAVSPFAHKGALVRGRDESHGVLFKGLTANYDSVFFQQKLLRGKLPSFSSPINSTPSISSTPPAQTLSSLPSKMPKPQGNQVLISEILARKLKVDTGQKLRAYFVDQEQLRPRAFEICGIYSSGLEKFDETYIFCDIAHIQAINQWESDQADGIDIRLHDPDKRHEMSIKVSENLPYEYSCFPCDYLFPEIFDWLTLIDTNVWVLLIIMLIVCMICMISVLFILIIERKPHIGILKSLGASNHLIRKIFVYQTLIIMGRSLLLGNALALLLAWIQSTTHLIRLEESIYFLNSVPVAFPWTLIISINLCVLAFAYLILSLVSLTIRRLSPASMSRK